MKLRKPWQQRTVGRIGNRFLRLLGATWRARVEFEPPIEPALYLFLHGNILPAAWSYRDLGLPILISTHRDGEMIAQVASRLGYVPQRGSSTRGGARGVREILRLGKDRAVAVTPDGPRGPRASVKPGLIQLAAYGGWPIQTAGFACDPAFRLRSWDRFTIPHPFARVVCARGERFEIPESCQHDDAQCEELATRVSAALLAADETAAARLAAW